MNATELRPEVVCAVISDAAEMGYEVVSVSGGEPLMYRGLEQVLSHAKSLGLRTTVTTNGFFTGAHQVSHLRGLVNVLAISLDGPPEIHNDIRGSGNAFKCLQSGLPNVRDAGIPFGFIHTLTRQTWEHLLWVADFAATNGAGLLQIHPLERSGRANSEMDGHALSDEDLAKAYVLAQMLAAKYAAMMRIQLDLLFRDDVHNDPSLVYAAESESDPSLSLPATVVGLLVLEADGTIVPVSYGVSRRYKVCNVNERGLAAAWPEYVKSHGHLAFWSLCREIWEELCQQDAPLLTNWHEMVVARSHLVEPATFFSPSR